MNLKRSKRNKIKTYKISYCILCAYIYRYMVEPLYIYIYSPRKKKILTSGAGGGEKISSNIVKVNEVAESVSKYFGK